MRITLLSGLTATVLGLGMLASAGSAYAAGCLQPGQTQYALSDDSDAAVDRTMAADAKGFSCNTGDLAVATQLSTSATPQHRAAASVAPKSEKIEFESLDGLSSIVRTPSGPIGLDQTKSIPRPGTVRGASGPE